MNISDAKWEEFVNLINRQEYVNSNSKYELTYDSFREELDKWLDCKIFTNEEWIQIKSELVEVLKENVALRNENDDLKLFLKPEVQEGLLAMRNGDVEDA